MVTTGRYAEYIIYVEVVVKKSDHTEENCPNETKCSNCQQNQPGFSRSCNIYKREREIMEIKYEKNILFLEARKIVNQYMKENSYTTVALKLLRVIAHTEWGWADQQTLQKLLLVTLVKGDPKAPFSIDTTPKCRGGHYSIPWIAPLYP